MRTLINEQMTTVSGGSHYHPCDPLALSVHGCPQGAGMPGPSYLINIQPIGLLIVDPDGVDGKVGM